MSDVQSLFTNGKYKNKFDISFVQMFHHIPSIDAASKFLEAQKTC